MQVSHLWYILHMKIHRFYMPHIDILEENTIVTYEIDLIHQLKNVFRYKTGQVIHIFNEEKGELEVELASIDKKQMSFKYIRQIKTPDSQNDTRKVSLYMSIIKNSNFDLIIEKAVELGVSQVIPVVSERTIKNNLNYERLRKIIKEATEQSGRVELMKIEETVDLKTGIEAAKNHSEMVYFGSVIENEAFTYKTGESYKVVGIFIGPEGGYSDQETVLFIKEGIHPIRLGNHVLRAETAAIVACGLLSL